MPTFAEVARDKNALHHIFARHGISNIKISAARVEVSLNIDEHSVWQDTLDYAHATGTKIDLPSYFEEVQEYCGTALDTLLVLSTNRSLTTREWRRIRKDVNRLHENPDGACTMRFIVESSQERHEIDLIGLQDYGAEP